MPSEDRRRTLLPYLAAAVVLLLLAMRVFSASGGGDTPAVALDGARQRPAASPSRAQGRVWVHVTGAVRRPGLYRLAADSRAGEALDAAGGFARRADLSAINLAATVRDGQQIVVPARGERAAAAAAAPGAPVPGASAPAPGAAPGAGAPAGAKVSLGTATVEQLDALDGIGPTLAQRIIQWRDAHGGFKSVDQLREVEGIGEKRFEALRAAVQP
jgi:competence protein ComEA